MITRAQRDIAEQAAAEMRVAVEEIYMRYDERFRAAGIASIDLKMELDVRLLDSEAAADANWLRGLHIASDVGGCDGS